MSYNLAGLQALPVELLYEIQLFALSENLPRTSHHVYKVFKHAPPVYNAEYILNRVVDSDELDLSEIYSRALRYPLCTQSVFQAVHNLVKDVYTTESRSFVHLPWRFFRTLHAPLTGWTSEDQPIPFLRYLFGTTGIPRIDVNYPDGYALSRAVYAKFIPLVEFLLENRASPKCRDRLAVKVAIRQKDLTMLKLLVERPQGKKRKGKRQKLEDRVTLDALLLRDAVSVGATDIVNYLYRDKGVVPDFQTLKRL